MDVNSGNAITVTLTANWMPTNYTIDYTLNGGSVATANPTSYNIETASFTLNNPTKAGYTFKGWSGTGISGDTNTSVTVTKGSTGNRSYTANWTINTYTLTYNNQSGSGCTSKTQTYGSAWGTLCTPTRSNYNFKGWYTGTNGSGTQVTASSTATANLTVYAYWEASTSYMQSFSCSSLAVGSTTTLTDSRDNNTYTVFHATGTNGLCWMSQNLRLIGSKTLTSADSNVSSNFTLPATNWSSSTDSTAKYTNAYTYDTGNTSYGVYYNYAAATAGTISGTSNSTAATKDICPKGWRLPTQTEMAALLTAYNVTNDSAGSTIMRSAPLNFVYSGYINYNNTSPSNQGSNGYWWSATAYSTTTGRYQVNISSSNANATSNSNRRSGYSIRCVAS